MHSTEPAPVALPFQRARVPLWDADGDVLRAVFAREALTDLPAPDAPDRRRAEQNLLANFFGIQPERVIALRQVHGTTSHAPDGSACARVGVQADGCFAEGDALFTREADILLVIRTADCLPVFFSLHDAGKRALTVGAIHAGWRGLKAGVIETTLDRAVAELARAGVARKGLRARVAIGPAISGERYEVGPEVAHEFPLFTPRTDRPGKFWLDLPANARRRLDHWSRESGIRVQADEGFAACSLGDDRFFSHRGGDGGRNLNCIMISTGPRG